MSKKLFAALMTAGMALSMSAVVFAATEADLPAEPEFEANEDYDKWTTVEYAIEDLGEDMVCTVSAKDDGSEYEILCSFYGDDQAAVVKVDGDEYTMVSDKTGFMEGDSPAIIQAAEEQDIWVYFDGAEASTEADTEAEASTEADVENTGEGATEADLPAEPEFDPNEDYDKWTTVEYTIEDLGEDMVCTVSAKDDGSEYEILCSFYGDDQAAVVKVDGDEYTMVSDKTGFMEGDSPAIIQAAIDQDIWVYFE